MKKSHVIVALLISTFMLSSFAAEIETPVGYWKTIDDVTGKPKAIIHITKASDNSLAGKVLKIFPRPGHDQSERCQSCPGDKKNQPIVGMVILENLKMGENQKQWTQGEILDPQNGKSYHCNLQMLAAGQKLNVRGYLGMPLFGRTQTWIRVNDAGKELA